MKPLRLLPKYLVISLVLILLAAGVTASVLLVVYRDAMSRVVSTAVDTNRAVLAEQLRAAASTPGVQLVSRLRCPWP